MTTSIFETLKKLDLASEGTRVLFNNRTRDRDNLKVWKDIESGVIYIDDFYTGDATYISGSYRNEKTERIDNTNYDFEKITDAERRVKQNLRFVAGKKIADFGCGSGDFLKLVKPCCEEVTGIELQQDFIEHLNHYGIKCINDINHLEDKSLDTIVSFHAIEHLPNPLEVMSALIRKVKSGGNIIIEVPHANDFLLSRVSCEEFKQFTLWSQHLILHTRKSLQKMLQHLGLKEIIIEGVQRYPLSNHLNWLSTGTPAGHKKLLSVLDSDILFSSYQSSLARIDATDTLVARAKVVW